MAKEKYISNFKAVQDHGLNRDRVFTDADAEWREIGVAIIALVERAGSVERYLEISHAMGVGRTDGGRS